MDDEAEPARRWGTWEELVLGAAVLRHGSDSWDSIASEVQTRTATLPHLFTPKECKGRYEGLQEQYNGCEALLEELRKVRVGELKREIEKTEYSIGSLQMKLETLKAVKQDDDFESDTCRLDSLLPVKNVDGGESTGKERSKDGSSAGSFTECMDVGISRDSSPGFQLPAIAAVDSEADGAKVKLELALDMKGKGRTLKKRRGRRRQKVRRIEAGDGGITGESEVLSPSNTVDAKDTDEMGRDCHKIIQVADSDAGCKKNAGLNLHWISQEFLDCIMGHKDAEVFLSRLDSQRRHRYRKLIRRHIDLEMIQRFTDEKSYTTSLEMLRDLLLLVNNALVYYRKDTSVYNSAVSLQKLVTEKFREFMDKDQGSDSLLKNLTSNPVKPRSARPRRRQPTIIAANEMVPVGCDDKSVEDASVIEKSGEDVSFIKKGSEAVPLIKKKCVGSIKKMREARSFIKRINEDASFGKRNPVEGVTKPSLPAKRRASQTSKPGDQRGRKKLKSSSGKGAGKRLRAAA